MNRLIHVLNFEGQIIDFISQSDSAIIRAEHNRDINDRTETFDFTILSDRTEHLQKKNRIIIQDSNKQYREFIIEHISQDIDGYTEIETTASYFEDLEKAKPYGPSTLSKMTTRQALSDVLKDTGWEVSDQTEYGGIRTTSWTSYQTRYEVLLQLCTTYSMMADYYIELGNNTVEGRFVVLRERNPMFNGKEITYGKDLIGLKRTVDFSEVKTALLCVGPEKEDGSRIELVVTDDEAQEEFGLPGRYSWGIYEPESDDQNMTEARLRTLGTTELNKRKSELISYEVTSTDISKLYKHEVTHLGDMVRIKNRDFTPPLYVEAEVISEQYDMITEESTYGFGQYKEYRESDLRGEFDKKLSDIRQKMNDSISNVNTIIQDTISGELEYYEKKIIKSDTPPDNPVNDMLWYDTSNPEVAVLWRYWNGEWREHSVNNVEKIGGITREKALYSELSNTFINLSIQHSKLLSDVYEVVNSEYLVDMDLKNEVNSKLNDTIGVFNQIKTNLDSMKPETATIGKLIDTQLLFLTYRERMQALYNVLENAKIIIDERFKLLQSQYTEEKYNEAMQKVADVIGGTYDAETGQLIADIPSKETLEEMRVTIENAMNNMSQENEVKLQELQNGITQTNQRITATSEELGAGITSVTKKVEGLQTDGNNLVRSFLSDSPMFEKTTGTSFVDDTKATLNSSERLSIKFYEELNNALLPNTDYTLKIEESSENLEVGVFYKKGSYIINSYANIREIKFNTLDRQDILIVIRATAANQFVNKISLYRGLNNLNWTSAPEDTDKQLSDIKTSVQTQSADIQLIKEGIKVKADSSEVTKIYDNYLTPLQTQVNQQKATLDILPSQIASKVSQSQYESDINDVVTRLNTSDSERKQLSHEVSDRVTKREYESGIADTRQYANDQIDNLTIGNVNLIRSYKSTQNIANGTVESDYAVRLPLSRNINFYYYDRYGYVNPPLEPNTDYILKLHEADPEVEMGVFYNQGKNTLLRYSKDRVMKFNTDDRIDFRIVIIARADNQFVGKVSLYKGTKELDWSPNPSDVEKNIRDTSENIKMLTEHDTLITQNGIDIVQRATKEEFNASKKTLSRVISDLTINTTSGLSLSYDENGSIQSHTVGPEGIKIKGEKVDIQANSQFSVLVGNVNNKVGYNEIINKINLSPEGLDINVNNVGIRGGDSTSYVSIKNDLIELSGKFTRTWRGETQNDFVFARFKNGLLRFRNNTRERSLYYSDFGISTFVDGESSESSGTLQFFDYTYSTARGVTLNSANGVVALSSLTNRVVLDANKTVNIESETSSIYFRPMRNSRIGRNEFRMWVKDNDTATDTDGVLTYGSLTSGSTYGSGIRFDKSNKTNFVYATNNNGDIGSGDFYARNLYGDWATKTDNLYAMVNSTLRVTDLKGYNNGNPNYKDFQCKDIQANTIRVNTGDNLYLGTSTGEVRVTNNLLYNSGSIGYKPIKAEDFIKASSAKFKKDIKTWNYDALSVIVDELQLYSYKYLDDERGLIQHGPVIGDGYDTPSEFIFADGINTNEMLSWALRAIQQLNEKINILEEKSI